MIKTQKELKRAIFNAQSSLTEEDIFLSEQYNDFLSQMQQGIVVGKKIAISSALFEGEEENVAFTDGQETKINYRSFMTNGLNLMEKHRLFSGLNLHEGGHLLFTNFELSQKILEKLALERAIYPSLPASTEYLDELNDFIMKYGGEPLLSLYKNLLNSIEDGYVDRAIMRLNPGYAECLRFATAIDRKDISTYKEMKDSNLSNEFIFANLVLAYARHGIRCYDDADSDELIDEFKKCESVIRKAVYETSPIMRSKLVWSVFCHLFHFIKERNNANTQNSDAGKSGEPKGKGNNKQDNKNSQGKDNSQDSGNASGNSQSAGGNEQSLADTLKNLGDSTKNSEKSEHKNSGTGLANDSKTLSDLANKDMPSDSDQNKEKKDSSQTNSDLKSLSESIAKDQVAKEQEKDIERTLKNSTCEIKNDFHKGIHSTVERSLPSEDGNKRYNLLHEELDEIVKRVIRSFSKEMEELKLGDTLTGLYSGKRINAREIYREDKKIMSRKIAPEDIPDMAVGIMIDLSGSMSGERINEARKCAYITYEFCRRLDIPVFVIGHCDNCGEVILSSVADESSLDDKDAKRIFSLTTRGCNRDGYALRFCMNKLDKIDATQKILFVISDGRPNSQNYKIEEGKIDCQQVVSEALKKGILTITAGIGDADEVKYVYKDGISDKNSATYLDLSNLDKNFSKQFIRILKSKLFQLY